MFRGPPGEKGDPSFESWRATPEDTVEEGQRGEPGRHGDKGDRGFDGRNGSPGEAGKKFINRKEKLL